jgi:hypothetical protein
MAERRRARIYAPFCSFPPVEGASQVIVEQARGLDSLGFDVEVLTWKGKIPKSGPAEAFRFKRLGNLPEEESRLSRMLRVGTSFARRTPSPEAYHYPLDPSLLDDLKELTKNPAEIGIYHFSFSHHWLSQGYSGGERKKFAHYLNLESELASLRAEKSRSPLFQFMHRGNARALSKNEKALGKWVDEIWFLSPKDQATWQASAPSGKGRFVGPCYSNEVYLKRRARFLSRKKAERDAVTLGFAAALDFQPNIESLGWLLTSLAPALMKESFEGKLLIAGRKMSSELRLQAERFPFIQVLGFVEDLEAFWSELTFSLAPDLGGSGVRMKTLESIVSGVPTLCHQISESRLEAKLRKHPLLHVSDDANAWAKMIMNPLLRSSRFHYNEENTNLPGYLQAPEIYGFLR